MKYGNGIEKKWKQQKTELISIDDQVVVVVLPAPTTCPIKWTDPFPPVSLLFIFFKRICCKPLCVSISSDFLCSILSGELPDNWRGGVVLSQDQDLSEAWRQPAEQSKVLRKRVFDWLTDDGLVLLVDSMVSHRCSHWSITQIRISLDVIELDMQEIISKRFRNETGDCIDWSGV